MCHCEFVRCPLKDFEARGVCVEVVKQSQKLLKVVWAFGFFKDAPMSPSGRYFWSSTVAVSQVLTTSYFGG